jgi:hypothetical protein
MKRRIKRQAQTVDGAREHEILKLKAAAYDTIAQLQQGQQILNQINARLSELRQPPMVSPKDPA